MSLANRIDLDFILSFNLKTSHFINAFGSLYSIIDLFVIINLFMSVSPIPQRKILHLRKLISVNHIEKDILKIV